MVPIFSVVQRHSLGWVVLQLSMIVLILWGVLHQAMATMLMDRNSCVLVEEEECGICHTIYMEECKIKVVEEMMPNKMRICQNVTR